MEAMVDMVPLEVKETLPEKNGFQIAVDRAREEILGNENLFELVELKKSMGGETGGVYPPETFARIEINRNIIGSESEGIDDRASEIRKALREMLRLADELSGAGQKDSELLSRMHMAALDISTGMDDIRKKKDVMEGVSADGLRRQKELAVETLVDEKTGVGTIGALVENNLPKIRRAMETGDMQELKRSILYYIDMMLFHRGNTVLTASGFDGLIFQVLGGLKADSRYLTRDFNALYRPFRDSEEMDSDKFLNLYFAPGSEGRQILDELRLSAEDVNTLIGRTYGSAGDEFFAQFDTEEGNSEQLRLALKAVNHVIKNTVISRRRSTTLEKDYKIEMPEYHERLGYFGGFLNVFNTLYVKQSAEYGIIEADTKYYYLFCNAMREYFRSKSEKFVGENGTFFDPQVETRLDYAHVRRGEGLPTLAEAEELARSGMMFDIKAGLYLDRDYFEITRRKLVNALSEKELMDQKVVDKALEEIVLKDILRYFYTRINDEVNAVSKREKKTDMIMKAIVKEDTQSMFTIGSVLMSSPDFGNFSEPQKIEILENLITTFKEKYEAEKRAGDSGKDYDVGLIEALHHFINEDRMYDRRRSERAKI